MKQRIRLALFIGFFLFGCSDSIYLYRPLIPLVTSAPLDAVGETASVLEREGWQLLSVRPEIIIARRVGEEGTATVAVKFGPQHIVIEHLASHGFGHGADATGHEVVAETYNIWVKELERAIAGQVSGV